MRIFKNSWFQRFARKERIADAALRAAIVRAEKGQIDADLGGGVIKQRLARHGEGKSGGYRAVVLFRSGDRAVFVYGFAKSSRDNIRKDEEEAFKKAGREVLALTQAQLDTMVAAGRFEEVQGNGEDEEI